MITLTQPACQADTLPTGEQQCETETQYAAHQNATTIMYMYIQNCNTCKLTVCLHNKYTGKPNMRGDSCTYNTVTAHSLRPGHHHSLTGLWASAKEVSMNGSRLSRNHCSVNRRWSKGAGRKWSRPAASRPLRPKRSCKEGVYEHVTTLCSRICA